MMKPTDILFRARNLVIRYVYRHIVTENILFVTRDIINIEEDIDSALMDDWVLISRDLSTCVSDKKRVEIYEGDILFDGLRKYVVEFYKGGFWLNQGKDGAEWQIHNKHWSCEIIANIHENKELIEEI